MIPSTLFISGADDFGAPAAEMESMSTAVPNASYLEIPNCAHIANLNQADAFNAALKQFLEF
jgi:3-oxoadipate enol-lactonase